MNSKEMEARLKKLAYRIVQMCEYLSERKISGVIQNQILRSSFSAAANYRAACRAIFRKSFVSKLSIAFEEADETLFWLESVEELKLVPPEKLSLLRKESAELASILASSRKTLQADKKE